MGEGTARFYPLDDEVDLRCGPLFVAGRRKGVLRIGSKEGEDDGCGKQMLMKSLRKEFNTTCMCGHLSD